MRSSNIRWWMTQFWKDKGCKCPSYLNSHGRRVFAMDCKVHFHLLGYPSANIRATKTYQEMGGWCIVATAPGKRTWFEKGHPLDTPDSYDPKIHDGKYGTPEWKGRYGMLIKAKNGRYHLPKRNK